MEYHHHDFDFDEWALEAGSTYTEKASVQESEENPTTEWIKWDAFFSRHKKGDFFKPRRYLGQEFSSYLPSLVRSSCEEKCDMVIVEVGCGHGCSMFPLLEKYPSIFFIATDYSNEALTIIANQPNYHKFSKRIETHLWDVVSPPSPELNTLFMQHFDKSFVLSFLLVFAISAIHPQYHVTSFQNIALLMRQMQTIRRTQSVILFRDYGVHDMTMYRHRIKYGENLYRRSDGTLAFYFTKAYLSKIAQEAGLVALELEYATVRVVNRKTNVAMSRVFVHAVFKLQDS